MIIPTILINLKQGITGSEKVLIATSTTTQIHNIWQKKLKLLKIKKITLTMTINTV